MIFREIVIILLIIQPLINKLTFKSGVNFDLFNELLSLLIIFMCIIQILRNKKLKPTLLLFALIVMYMVGVIIIKQLNPISFLQVLIYSQWFFFFLYFFTLTVSDKTKTFIAFKKILDKVLIFIALLSLVEIFYYDAFRDFLEVNDFERGIGGFYLVSFFGSGASLGNFCSLYVFSWFYYHFGCDNKIEKQDRIKIILAIVILILSFSRKEVLFTVLFFLFFPFDHKSKVVKGLKKFVLLVGVLLGSLFYYNAFFVKANQVALGEDYVRWKIAGKSMEILNDNLPWGTGVGTFGSRVSLMNPRVYQKYNIGPEMLGYESLGQTRGPIYDVFLFTFTTEMGIGILLFLFFFIRLYMAPTVSHNKYKKYIKNFIILYFFGLSVFQPVLISSFGYLCAIFLALAICKVSFFKYENSYVKN